MYRHPGSTSTKIGVFEDETLLFEETLRHSTEEISQYAAIVDQKQDDRCGCTGEDIPVLDIAEVCQHFVDEIAGMDVREEDHVGIARDLSVGAVTPSAFRPTSSIPSSSMS